MKNGRKRLGSPPEMGAGNERQLHKLFQTTTEDLVPRGCGRGCQEDVSITDAQTSTEHASTCMMFHLRIS